VAQAVSILAAAATKVLRERLFCVGISIALALCHKGEKGHNLRRQSALMCLLERRCGKAWLQVTASRRHAITT